jgi:hypothetical protein
MLTVRRDPIVAASFAAIRARMSIGTEIARTALMMPTTTSSSNSVNPDADLHGLLRDADLQG